MAISNNQQLSDLDQFHRFEQAAKLARQAGNLDAADELREKAAQHLYSHYQAESAASGQSDPTSGMTSWEKLKAGTGQGAVDVGRHIKNLFGFTSDDELKAAQEQDAPLLNTREGQIGSLLGQTGATAAGGMVAGALAPEAAFAGSIARAAQAAQKAGQVIPKAGMIMRAGASPVARAILGGATQGAVMTDPGGSRVANALIGGGLGAAVPALGAVGKRVVRGLDRTSAANQLINKGVYPTAGQLKPTGVMATIEQTPGIRQVMHWIGGKEGVKREYLRALAQEVTPPGTTIQLAPGQNMLDQAYQAFQPLYDAGKGYPVAATIKLTGRDVPLVNAVNKAVDATPGLLKGGKEGAGVKDWFNKNLRIAIQDAGPNGLQSEHLLQLRSDTRDVIRSLGKNTDAPSIAQRNAYKAIDKKITESLRSHLPPQAMDSVDLADQHYKSYKLLEDAFRKADAAGRGEVGPTVTELTKSLASASKGTGAGQAARGVNQSELKKLADAGATTFAEMPEMRTGHGLAATAGILSGGALAYPLAAAHPFLAPIAAGAAILGSGSQATRKALAGRTNWQRGIRSTIAAAARGTKPKLRTQLKGLRDAASQLAQRGTIAELAGPASQSIVSRAPAWAPAAALPDLGTPAALDDSYDQGQQ